MAESGVPEDPADRRRAADRPPPAGWQRPGERQAADLQRRLAEAGRELLLAVRALIDWQLERLEAASGTEESYGGPAGDAGAGDSEPRDIPII
ncbi:MAG TPA: hypothetical protein VMU66_00070 [Gaiellales bacterium]|nr:hypothetical protein [Gaiellales bacterium]